MHASLHLVELLKLVERRLARKPKTAQRGIRIPLVRAVSDSSERTTCNNRKSIVRQGG
jgi:hypothetical protein